MFRNVVSAMLASILWICASLLLVMRADGLSFDLKIVAEHITEENVYWFIGILIAFDIGLDTFVVGNKDGLFNVRPKFAFAVVVFAPLLVFFPSNVAAMMLQEFPDALLWSAFLAFFVLFSVRALSYVKVVEVVKVGSPVGGHGGKR